MATLEYKADVAVDADGAGDALLHLAVAGLQLLQQVVLLGALRAGTEVHLRLVWKKKRYSLCLCASKGVHITQSGRQNGQTNHF